MGQFAGIIAKLGQLKDRLNVRPFYITHLPAWQERAKRIAAAVLENARPDDVLPEIWRQRVVTDLARLSALLEFGPDEAGVIISLGIPSDGPSDSPKRFSLGDTSIADVERWVQAGREGADLGKKLDERDAHKSNLQIAWRVMWALKLGKPGWERLLGHISEFTGIKQAAAAEGMYASVLVAWMEQLGPEIREDFRDWVRLQIARTFQPR